MTKNNCKNCNKVTTNPRFCGSSCAASYNNKKVPKRKRRICYCKYCNTVIPYRRTVCNSCNPNVVDWEKITVGDARYKRKYQKHSRFRDLARRLYFSSGRSNSCANCGYAVHIQVCHIKPVHSFPDTDFVSDINSLDNLVGLCPNCHWELDNGHLLL